MNGRADSFYDGGSDVGMALCIGGPQAAVGGRLPTDAILPGAGWAGSHQ